MAEIFGRYPLEPSPDSSSPTEATAATLTAVNAGTDGVDWVTPATLAASDTVAHPADLAGEASARAAAVTGEAAARGNADTTLQNNLTAEATARGAGDTAETTARSNADNTLQTNLTAEVSARTTADTTLQGNLTVETNARTAADTAEATTRAGADTALQNTINSLAASARTDTTSASNVTTGTLSAERLPKNVSLVAYGDSRLAYLVQSNGADGGIPEMLAGNVPFTQTNLHNVAVSGQGAAAQVPGQGAGAASGYDAVVHPYRPTVGQTAYFCYWAGVNDCSGTDSAATIYTHLHAVWAAARADGFVVVAFTLPPTDNAVYNPTKITALTALIKSDTSLYDYRIDVDVVLPNYSDPTLYNPADHTHPTPKGNAIIATNVLQVLGFPLRNPAMLTGFTVAGGLAKVDSSGNAYFAGSISTAAINVAAGGNIDSNGTPIYNAATGIVNAPFALQVGGNALSDAYGSVYFKSATTAPTNYAGAGYAQSYANTTDGLVHIKGTDGVERAVTESLIYSNVLANDSTGLTITIPSGFHHLRIKCTVRTTFGTQVQMVGQLNADSTVAHYPNYPPNPGTAGGIAGILLGQANGSDAPVPSESETILSLRSLNSICHSSYYVNGGMNLIAGSTAWTGTGPVTTITIPGPAGNFKAGSAFYIYGY